jgi:hypothetical protein
LIVLEGRATYAAGSDTVEARAGQVLMVEHRFVNSGDSRLRQIDIHASDRFVTEWLEARRAEGPETIAGLCRSFFIRRTITLQFRALCVTKSSEE